MAEIQQDPSSKVCAFYLSPRGCIKGDSCDFNHPNAPDGSVTSKVCDFFKSAKGCTKGDECNFLHPEGHVNARPGFGGGQKVCQFFATPRGCIKGDACDFAHPNLSAKPCTFFLSARGCVKGNDCDFSHAHPSMMPGFPGAGVPSPFDAFASAGMGYPGMGPQGLDFGRGMPQMGMPQMRGQPGVPPHLAHKRPQICQYHNTERGCVKGAQCDFVHQREKVCDFWNTERGCRKGKYCDFQHPPKDEAMPGKTAKETTNHRFSPY